MDRGKDPLLLPYTYTLSSNIVDLLLALLNLQYYQRCESMILKTGWKVNLFCDNQIIITYWLKLTLVEDLIRFELFLIDPHAGDIENKNIAGKCYKILESVSPTLY